MGGKSKIGERIAEVLNSLRKPGQTYYEPCMGSCSVLQYIKDGPNEASDLCAELVALFNALKSGWVPPDEVSEEDYAQAKAGNCSPELRAFVGFGCSFGAKWFGGYARRGHTKKQNHLNYAQCAKRSLANKMELIHPDTKFIHRSLYDLNCTDGLIYFDPPYFGTTSYKAAGKFDHGSFWYWVRQLSLKNTVIISEYEAPPDFDCILEFEHATCMRSKKNKPAKRIEKIFRIKK